MKTLVNKANPQIRITAPEIKEIGPLYTLEVAPELVLYVDDWTFVEGIKGNLEEMPSNVDLEKEIQRYLCEECSSDDEPTITEIARHFYELGKLNAKEE